jgi:phage shock protein PspC (stress-responsive transcriptional regulator)
VLGSRIKETWNIVTAPETETISTHTQLLAGICALLGLLVVLPDSEVSVIFVVHAAVPAAFLVEAYLILYTTLVPPVI